MDIQKERENYQEELKFYAQQLAYSSFANKAFVPLVQRGLDIDAINKFTVVFFFTQKLKEDNSVYIDFTVRYTLMLEIGNQLEEITFVRLSDIYQEAIIDKVYKEKFGPFQHFSFDFNRPNTITLFDADYLLEEKLGVFYE